MTKPGTHAAPRAMRYPGYRRLMFCDIISMFGMMSQVIARGWLARELTGNNAGLGGVMLAFGLCSLVATPLGGVAADRFAKRHVLMVGAVMMSMGSLWVGLAHQADAIEYWMLVAASGLMAAGMSVYLPARVAYIGELVDAEAFVNGIVLSQVTGSAMRVVGPGIAGLLIGLSWFGVGGIFLMAAALNFSAVFFALRLPLGRPQAGAVRATPRTEFVEGVAYVRADPVRWMLMLTTIGVTTLGLSYYTFLPAMAEEVFDRGVGAYGLMTMFAALGAVPTGLLLSRRHGDRTLWTVVTISGATLGALCALLGFLSSFVIALGVLTVMGGCAIAFQSACQGLLLAISDHRYHGRVQSLFLLGFIGFGLAAFPLGLLADAIGIRETLVILGASVFAVIVMFEMRKRQVRATHPQEIAVAPATAPVVRGGA